MKENQDHYCWKCKYNTWVSDGFSNDKNTHLCTNSKIWRIIPEEVVRYFSYYGCASFELKDDLK